MLKINLKNKKIYIILISLNTKKNFENNYYTILQTLSFLSLRYVTMGEEHIAFTQWKIVGSGSFLICVPELPDWWHPRFLPPLHPSNRTFRLSYSRSKASKFVLLPSSVCFCL